MEIKKGKCGEGEREGRERGKNRPRREEALYPAESIPVHFSLCSWGLICDTCPDKTYSKNTYSQPVGLSD